MGQKVNPRSMRLQVTRDWDSVWYADKRSYAKNLKEDVAIRAYLLKNFKYAFIGRILIKRKANVVVDIYATRVGVLVGKNGSDIDKIKKYLTTLVGCNSVEVNAIELKRPELHASLVANNIAQQLERRVSFRKAMKRAISSSLRAGVKGIKVSCSGRLGGAEIARREWYREGSMPLHTLKANIEYATAEAKTTYGVVGTKVWIYG